VIDYIVEGQRPFEGSFPFDEEALRELVARIVDRTLNIESSMNHWILDDGEPVQGRLDELEAPTLVLHGTEDPLFPLGHGEALAAEIPGARLLPLEGMGHQVPPRPLWAHVVETILEHTTNADADAAAGARAQDPTLWL